jgi:hypothetical protein
MDLNKVAQTLTKAAVVVRDLNAIKRTVEQSSVMPVARRLWNRAAGRVVSRLSNPLFWKGGRKS